MEVREIVKNLNSIFAAYTIVESEMRNKYRLERNDIRFTYFRTSHHNIDATIHLLMMSETNISSKKYLQSVYSHYSITDRFDIYAEVSKTPQQVLTDVISFFIANGYFSSMYHLFENAFRIICEEYNAEIYDRQKGKFHNIFEKFVKMFRTIKILDGISTEVFEYINILRNSIHNNGVYISKDKIDRPDILNFDGKRITIKHRQVIPVDNVWQDLFKMSSWYLIVFASIIRIPKIESVPFILDYSQQNN